MELLPAVRRGGTSLRMLAPDGTPLERRYVCPAEDVELSPEEIVRGYELDDGEFVLVTDDELEALAPEKSRDIALSSFVDREAIGSYLLDRPYYLAPSGGSTTAYRLLAEVMERTGKAGIATFVMRGKEYLVAIVAEHGILRAQTMRFLEELRSPEQVGLPSPRKVDDSGRRRKVVRGGRGRTGAVSGEVIDLMEALKRRLAQRRPGAGAGGISREKLRQQTKKELYRRAQELDVPGRSEMTKPELVEALARAS